MDVDLRSPEPILMLTASEIDHLLAYLRANAHIENTALTDEEPFATAYQFWNTLLYIRAHSRDNRP
jgi:hypothetical protein